MAARNSPPPAPPLPPPPNIGAAADGQRRLGEEEMGNDDESSAARKAKAFSGLTDTDFTYQSGFSEREKTEFADALADCTAAQRRKYLRDTWFLPNSLSMGLLREFFGDGFPGALLGTLIKWGLQKYRVGCMEALAQETRKAARELGMEGVEGGGANKKFTAETSAQDPNYDLGKNFTESAKERIAEFWAKEIDKGIDVASTQHPRIDSNQPDRLKPLTPPSRALTSEEQVWVQTWRARAIASFDSRSTSRQTVDAFLTRLAKEFDQNALLPSTFKSLAKAQKEESADTLKLRLMRAALVDLGLGDSHELTRLQDLNIAVDSSPEHKAQREKALERLGFDPLSLLTDIKQKASVVSAANPLNVVLIEDVKESLQTIKNSDLPLAIRQTLQFEALKVARPLPSENDATEDKKEKLKAYLKLCHRLLEENKKANPSGKVLVHEESIDVLMKQRAKDLTLLSDPEFLHKAAGDTPAAIEAEWGKKVDLLRDKTDSFAQEGADKILSKRQLLDLRYRMVAEYNDTHNTSQVYPLTPEEALELKQGVEAKSKKDKRELTLDDKKALQAYVAGLGADVLSERDRELKKFVEEHAPLPAVTKPVAASPAISSLALKDPGVEAAKIAEEAKALAAEKAKLKRDDAAGRSLAGGPD